MLSKEMSELGGRKNMYGCKLQIKYTVKVGRLFSKEQSKQHTNLS